MVCKDKLDYGWTWNFITTGNILHDPRISKSQLKFQCCMRLWLCAMRSDLTQLHAVNLSVCHFETSNCRSFWHISYNSDSKEVIAIKIGKIFQKMEVALSGFIVPSSVLNGFRRRFVKTKKLFPLFKIWRMARICIGFSFHKDILIIIVRSSKLDQQNCYPFGLILTPHGGSCCGAEWSRTPRLWR